jgi:hypothetical protein
MKAPTLAAYENYLAHLVPQPQLRAIKDVEMDLRGVLNPSTLLHELYFEQYNWLSFDEFFELYSAHFEQQLAQQFHIDNWQQFGQGLRARLYRTQFGFLTEYHAYFLAKDFFGEDKVYRSTALDKKGVDFQIKVEQQVYNMHIFVDTLRAWEFRNFKSKNKQVDSQEGIHVNLPYSLAEGRFNSLYYLPNRFGIYTKKYLEYFKQEIMAKRILHNNIIGTTASGFVYSA